MHRCSPKTVAFPSQCPGTGSRLYPEGSTASSMSVPWRSGKSLCQEVGCLERHNGLRALCLLSVSRTMSFPGPSSVRTTWTPAWKLPSRRTILTGTCPRWCVHHHTPIGAWWAPPMPLSHRANRQGGGTRRCQRRWRQLGAPPGLARLLLQRAQACRGAATGLHSC